MKLTIQSKELLAALALLKPICSGANIGCLNCVLLEASGTKLSLSGSNLECRLSLQAFAEVKKAGAVAVSCSALLQTVSLMEGEIAIELDSKLTLSLRQGARLRSIPGIDPKEMAPMAPNMTPEGGFSEPVQFESGVLPALIAKELPFVGDNPVRYVLQGVYFGVFDSMLAVYASDGGTMRRETTHIPFGGSFVMPPATASMLSSLASEACDLRWSENLIEARGDKWCLTSKLIEGTFPQTSCDRIIRDRGKLEASTFKRSEMLSALRFAGLEADLAPGRCVRLEASNGDLILSAGSDGSSRVSLHGSGRFKAKAAYGVHYLTAAIKSFSGEDQTLLLSPMDPGIIEDATGTVAICPIRTV